MSAWDGKLDVLVVGGGMISVEVILPTVFQERRRGKVGKVLVASRTVRTMQNVRKLFPTEEFSLYPVPEQGSNAGEKHPHAFRQALQALGKNGVVIVATPDSAHTSLILESIEAGCHVVVEKPLCLKVTEARKIRDAADRKAMYVYTDYHKRHDYAIRAAKYRYEKGDLGEMLHGHAWIEEKKEMALETFASWAHESSPFEYIGVHYADAYYFITGLLPKRLSAFAQKKFLPGKGIDAYDAVQAVIEWSDGSAFWVQTSWVLPQSNTSLTNQGMQLTGTKGEYKSDHKDRHTFFNTDEGGYEHYNPYFFKPYRPWGGPLSSYKNEKESTEWAGYGYESIMLGLNDIRDILKATEGLGEDEAFKKRKEIIVALDKVRPLPRQSTVGTAMAEAARMSFENQSRFVSFDEEMNLHLEP